MAPKSKKNDIMSATTSKTATKTRLNWPAFTPLFSQLDLSLEEIIPQQIVCIHNFWTSTLCKNYVTFLSSLPLATTPGKPKKGDAVRVNDRFQIDDPDFAERLWNGSALRHLITTEEGSGLDDESRKKLWGSDVVGLNPNIRIYRYRKGQFFDQHCEHLHYTTLLIEANNAPR
jgi:hypothetical protein